MSSAREGWYQDPTAPERLRWWDGAAWTGHTTAHPDTTSSEDGVDHDRAASTRPSGSPAPTGGERTFGQSGEPSGGAPGSDPPQRSEAELTPVWADAASGTPSVPPPRSWQPAPSGAGRGGAVAALASIAVIVVVVVAGLVGLGASDREVVTVADELDVTVDEPGFDAAGDLVVPPEQLRDSGRTLRLGGSAVGEVVADEGWTAQLEVADDVAVRIDVRGVDGFDVVATLRDADGQVVVRNDDRGDDGVARVGGDQLDPLLEAELAAGVYELEVVGFATLPGSFAVRVDPSSAS